MKRFQLKGGTLFSRIFILKREENRCDYLENFKKAKRWAQENINDLPSSFYDNNEDKYSQEDIITKELIEKRIREYVTMYGEISPEDTITLYRAICVSTIKHIDFDAIGVYWSFKKEGADCYGANSEEKPRFILKGDLKGKDIDWEHGFYSFVWYGEEQWECALKKGSIITIKEINGEKLKNPKKARI
jgi:hypothetical protein